KGIEKLRLNGRFGISSRAPLLYVANDSHDLRLNIELFQVYPFADRVLMREIGTGKNVIDVDDHRGVLIVLRADETAALQRKTHGLLEAGLGKVKHSLRHLIVIRGFGPAFNPEWQR